MNSMPMFHEEWFEFWIKRRQAPFWVRPSNHKWEPWLLTGSSEFQEYYRCKPEYPKHRIVFADEVVFDIDVEDKKLNKEAMEAICTKMDKDNISYDVWNTGSKKASHHIHALFPELLEYGQEDRRTAKEAIMRYYAYEYIIKAKIDMLVAGKKHLIRMEGAEHEKTYKDKVLLRFNGELKGNNTIPEIVINTIQKVFHTQLEQMINPEIVLPMETKGRIPPCIAYFTQDEFANIKDLRKTALFVMVSYFKRKMNPEELFAYLSSWNQNVLKGYFLQEDIRSMVLHHTSKEHLDRIMGCSYIQTGVLSQISSDKGTMKESLCSTCWCKDRIRDT